MYADYLRSEFADGFTTGIVLVLILTVILPLIGQSPFRWIHESALRVLIYAILVPVFTFILIWLVGISHHPIWILGEGTALFLFDMMMYSIKQKRDAKKTGQGQ